MPDVVRLVAKGFNIIPSTFDCQGIVFTNGLVVKVFDIPFRRDTAEASCNPFLPDHLSDIVVVIVVVVTLLIKEYFASVQPSQKLSKDGRVRLVEQLRIVKRSRV